MPRTDHAGAPLRRSRLFLASALALGLAALANTPSPNTGRDGERGDRHAE